jgi:hypothetical protein
MWSLDLEKYYHATFKLSNMESVEQSYQHYSQALTLKQRTVTTDEQKILCKQQKIHNILSYILYSEF